MATITIRIFARSFVGSGPDVMHNEVRVDPNNEIAEIDETNNLAFQDTVVSTGGARIRGLQPAHDLEVAGRARPIPWPATRR